MQCEPTSHKLSTSTADCLQRDLQQRLTASMKAAATLSDDFEKQKLALATEQQGLEELESAT